MKHYPQSQLLLPLLTALEEAGGKASTRDLCEAAAHKLNISESERSERIEIAGKLHNAWDYRCRWTQQTAKNLNLMAPAGKPYWRLTGKGEKSLAEALPGIVVTIFTTESGVALWGDCLDAVAYVDDGAVNLLFTSPPYPLNKKRAYGNLTGPQYLDWLVRIIEAYLPKMATDGSIVLDLCDVYRKGAPFLNLYQEQLLLRLQSDLGLNLCGKFPWYSPSKMPSAHWVTVERVRVTNAVETMFWLAASEPYADNRQVLRQYSASYAQTLAKGVTRSPKRPSGYMFKEGAHLKDNRGSIPHNVIVCPGVGADDNGYKEACRKAGLPAHPARMPRVPIEFIIKFLTRRGQVIADTFAGSYRIGEIAEELGRYWIGVEKIFQYVSGGAFRFHSPVFTDVRLDQTTCERLQMALFGAPQLQSE